MEGKEICFEVTPQIIRYLETLLDIEDKFFAQLTNDVVLIETYIPGENVNLKAESNMKGFWLYLAKTKAIEYLTDWHGKNGISDWVFIKPGLIEGQRATLGYPKKQSVRILDVNKIKQLYDELNKQPNLEHKTNSTTRHRTKLFSGELKTEIEIGKLASYNDGTIRYDGEIIDMRNQTKDLCRLFMENPNRLLTLDDIKEAIIKYEKRKNTKNATISKYACELRSLLKIHFKRNVLVNQPNEGWRLQIE